MDCTHMCTYTLKGMCAHTPANAHTHTSFFLKIKYLEKIKNSEQELEVGMAGESLHGQFIPKQLRVKV